ncbi:unnamed protein product [Protopolystoma xenopodis]|uniref:Uncharacterized protein n=1 Tax=Protopolystoma xenopodis TaxID=117903 RepID=A0A3S5C8C4_9PLAT|nr:unnamed protein product [Protopolystoma xenopodis]
MPTVGSERRRRIYRCNSQGSISIDLPGTSDQASLASCMASTPSLSSFDSHDSINCSTCSFCSWHCKLGYPVRFPSHCSFSHECGLDNRGQDGEDSSHFSRCKWKSLPSFNFTRLRQDINQRGRTVGHRPEYRVIRKSSESPTGRMWPLTDQSILRSVAPDPVAVTYPQYLHTRNLSHGRLQVEHLRRLNYPRNLHANQRNRHARPHKVIKHSELDFRRCKHRCHRTRVVFCQPKIDLEHMVLVPFNPSAWPGPLVLKPHSPSNVAVDFTVPDSQECYQSRPIDNEKALGNSQNPCSSRASTSNMTITKCAASCHHDEAQPTTDSPTFSHTSKTQRYRVPNLVTGLLSSYTRSIRRPPKAPYTTSITPDGCPVMPDQDCPLHRLAISSTVPECGALIKDEESAVPISSTSSTPLRLSDQGFPGVRLYFRGRRQVVRPRIFSGLKTATFANHKVRNDSCCGTFSDDVNANRDSQKMKSLAKNTKTLTQMTSGRVARSRTIKRKCMH